MRRFLIEYIYEYICKQVTLLISHVHNSYSLCVSWGKLCHWRYEKSTAIKMVFVLSKSCYVNALIKTRCNDEPFSNNNQRPR